MSETPQQEPVEMHPHLEQYPNAVQDAEKAHTLAMVGDQLESESAQLRQESVRSLGSTAYEGGYMTDEAREAEAAVAQIESNNRIVDTIYSQHASAYDKLESTKR